MSKQHYKAGTYTARASVGYMIKRSHSLMLDALEPILAERGFTFIQYIILAWLRDGIAVNPKDICHQFRHDSGALTRVIDQLAERGLLERIRRDRDRRKVELRLTPLGRRTIDGLLAPIGDTLNRALADFTSAEFRELQRLLTKLSTTLQSLVDPRGEAAAPGPPCG